MPFLQDPINCSSIFLWSVDAHLFRLALAVLGVQLEQGLDIALQGQGPLYDVIRLAVEPGIVHRVDVQYLARIRPYADVLALDGDDDHPPFVDLGPLETVRSDEQPYLDHLDPVLGDAEPKVRAMPCPLQPFIAPNAHRDRDAEPYYQPDDRKGRVVEYAEEPAGKPPAYTPNNHKNDRADSIGLAGEKEILPGQRDLQLRVAVRRLEAGLRHACDASAGDGL